MNKEQRQAIRKFETWQQRKFASNAKKGRVFFRPDRFEQATPRSAREAWGGVYQNGHRDDKQERMITLLIYAFAFSYVLFLLWREFQ